MVYFIVKEKKGKGKPLEFKNINLYTTVGVLKSVI
jgi:hypothetical protein